MINIAFCFDENVIGYLKVSILSMLSNKNASTHYNNIGICTSAAYCCYPELCELVETRDPLSKIHLTISRENVSNAYEIRNITSATYYRFDLANYYPKVEKAIYLDTDTLITGDLSELWNIDTGNNYVCGVRADVNLFNSWNNKRRNCEYWHELDDWKGNYINAGVMLMNFNLIRKSNISHKWKSLISFPYFYQDQDIINLSCKPNIGILPMKFNFMTFYTEEDYENLVFQNVFTACEVSEAKSSPIIIHYAGKKPWSDLDTKLGDLWWNFVLKDPYLCKNLKEKQDALAIL